MGTSVYIQSKKVKPPKAQDVYEQQVNKRICASAGADAQQSDDMPKVTFAAKETYQEV